MKAKKSLGQNFLNNLGTLQKIVDAGNLNESDEVIEVGPGHGLLTEALSPKVKKIITIELDQELIPKLKERFKYRRNIDLIHADALTYEPPETPYKLIANIPYYITSPLLNHFLKDQPAHRRPTHIVLLVQKEVAEKILEPVGNLSVLALQVQLFGKPSIVAVVPASHFTPKPKVDSAILKIEMYPKALAQDDEIKKIFQLIHIGFHQRRKKLTKNLKSLNGVNEEKLKNAFEALGLNPNVRAQELSMEQWLGLKNIL